MFSESFRCAIMNFETIEGGMKGSVTYVSEELCCAFSHRFKTEALERLVHVDETFKVVPNWYQLVPLLFKIAAIRLSVSEYPEFR